MIENGIVYEVREGKTYKEKLLKCYENKLQFNINMKETETSKILTGIIYKEHHENGVVELTNDIEVLIQNYDNILELTPNRGMVDINLELPKEIESIFVREKNVINVNGFYDLKGVK